MSTIGRNDPCPCGSGKKYKQCCGATTIITPDFKYERIRGYDGESAMLLAKFARKRFGEHAIDDAKKDFYSFEESPSFRFSNDDEYFNRWFLFDWKPNQRESLATMFLSEKRKTLDVGLARFIERTVQSPYSFYQVLAVDKGSSITLRDILRKHEVCVTERTASMMVERGQIILARVVELNGVCFFMGNGAQPFLPSFLDNIIELRSELEQEQPLRDDILLSETLLRNEELLRKAYFEFEEQIKNPKLKLRNTDGEELLYHTSAYSISSFSEAFQALKDLQQAIDCRTDEELLSDAERNGAGEPEKICLHWLKKSKERGNIILGTLIIEPQKLTVEANSAKRFKRIQKEIKKRLGDTAILLTTEIKSSESMMKEALEAKPELKKESDHDRILRENPEAKLLMQEYMAKHWASWADTPIPALRGMTPRNAAKNAVGRELLESLFMDYEMKNKVQEDELLKVDTAKLRHELGMGE